MPVTANKHAAYLLTLALFAAAQIAHAQDYPSKAIRVVVP